LNRILTPLLAFATVLPLAAALPPTVGEKARDFTLSTPEGKHVRLSEVMSQGPVALVVLRGYPGYQCPYCNRQVQDFIQKAQGFADAGAHVVLVYPGPAQDLDAKANEFLADKKLPANLDLVVDPDYEVTNLYGLRWDAPPRNGLSVDISNRPAGRDLLQQNRQGTWRADDRRRNTGCSELMAVAVALTTQCT
jgi:peroxiredoxin